MRSDVERINIQIERAERLLAYQQIVLARLRPHMPEQYVATVRDLTEIMEDRVVALYRQQRRYFAAAGPAHLLRTHS